jgi:hypothetical protein
VVSWFSTYKPVVFFPVLLHGIRKVASSRKGSGKQRIRTFGRAIVTIVVSRC